MLSVNTCLFLKDHVYTYFKKGCTVFGTKWTRHWWCFIAITKDCRSSNIPPLENSYGLCEPACHLPWQDHAVWCTRVPADGCFEQRHSWSSPYILYFPESAFPVASDCWNQTACEWSPQCTAAPPLAVELGSLGCLSALCPGRLSLLSLIPCSSLCSEPSITVLAASPSLFLSMDHNQMKETSREGRNRSMCLGVILSKVLFSGCMTPGEDQSHPCCEGAGVAQHQAVAQTGLSSWLYFTWVPLALARLRKCQTLNLPSRSHLLVCVLRLPVSFIDFILISFLHSTRSQLFS